MSIVICHLLLVFVIRLIVQFPANAVPWQAGGASTRLSAGDSQTASCEMFMAEKITLLTYDTTHTVGSGLKLDQSDLNALFPRLEVARQQVLERDLKLFDG